VIAVGVIAGVVFALIELTGSDVDRHASQVSYTVLATILFMVFGSTGVALAHRQPRFAPLGAATTTLSLLAFGATTILQWAGDDSLFGLGFAGTGGTVAGITDLLAIAAATACVLLATMRPGENAATRLVRLVAIGSSTLFIALGILVILDHDIDIGSRVYAAIATVYMVATAILLVLRLLPTAGEASRPAELS
jgi:hypothetical protein